MDEQQQGSGAQGFETLAIHAGQEPDPTTGAVVPPIYQVSTYAQDGVGGLRGGYEYSRSANPTRDALQECLAALEARWERPPGLRWRSPPGSRRRTPCSAPCAGPTTTWCCRTTRTGARTGCSRRSRERWGVEHTPARLTDLAAVRAAVQPGRTRIVWIETPTNPLLRVADIAALADVAHDAGAMLVVDNTFASPYLQQPLLLGADVVVHSTTKYLGGHSDVVGGALVVLGRRAWPSSWRTTRTPWARSPGRSTPG